MTLLYILISALKSNSQRSDSVDRSQLHTNFGKSYANNTCVCPGLHLLRCVFQEQTRRDHGERVFGMWGQRSKRGNDGFLNPTTCQEILLMSFTQLALLEWLLCALYIGHISPYHLKVAAIAPNTMSSYSEGQKQEKKGERYPHAFLSFIFQRRQLLLKTTQ